MSRTPQVETGYRAPRGNAVPGASEHGPGSVSAIPEGKRVFNAIAGRYRLQLTAPKDMTFTDGRIVRGERAKVAQFHEHLLKLDIKNDAEVIKMIEEHPSFGVDFWDLQTKLDQAREKAVEGAVKLLQDPVAREAIELALLMSKEEDFSLPKK